MVDLGTVGRALKSRPLLIKQLSEAEEAAARPLPWYLFFERRSWLNTIATLQAEIAEFDQKIGADGAQRLADTAADQLWKVAADAIIPNKNPYGRAAGVHFNQILAQVWATRDMTDFVVGDNSLVYRVTDVPEVGELVTEGFLWSSASARIAECTLIARNTDLRSEKTHCDNMEAMIIQHRASGLRAMFMLHGDGFGEVASTPSSVKSIVPGYPTESQKWRDFLGLGIGRRIYNNGHSLHPGVRWISKAGTPYAEGLRKKLHAADPYTWEDKCQWCQAEVIRLGIGSWKAADRNFFANHP